MLWKRKPKDKKVKLIGNPTEAELALAEVVNKLLLLPPEQWTYSEPTYSCVSNGQEVRFSANKDCNGFTFGLEVGEWKLDSWELRRSVALNTLHVHLAYSDHFVPILKSVEENKQRLLEAEERAKALAEADPIRRAANNL